MPDIFPRMAFSLLDHFGQDGRDGVRLLFSRVVFISDTSLSSSASCAFISASNRQR
jgi:hypothetical protein